MRALLVTATLLASVTSAAERPLSFTIAGPLVEAGAAEVLLSTTPRFGRPSSFTRFENLAGVAYGFSSKLEAQLLLGYAVESSGQEIDTTEGSVATRWRWQPLDGARDLLGLDLIGTVAVSPKSVFVEARLGAEKWFGDFLFAVNVLADYVVRSGTVNAPDTHLEQSGGIVYRLGNRFTSGFEVRNRIGFKRGESFGDALYAGPVFGYRRTSWWLSLGFLPQIAAIKVAALVGNGESLEIRDNERFLMRLQLGFELP